MKTLRKFLVGIFAMICVVGTAAISEVWASETAYFAYDNIQAGTTVVWVPQNPSGFILTSGGTQKIKVDLTTMGNSIETGIYSVARNNYMSFFSGKVSNLSTGEVSKVLSEAGGYYKVYVKNKNKDVSFTVQSTSYFIFD